MPSRMIRPILPDDCLELCKRISQSGRELSRRDALIVGLASCLALAPADFRDFSMSERRPLVNALLPKQMADWLEAEAADKGDKPFADMDAKNISKIISNAGDSAGMTSVTGLSPKIGAVIALWKAGKTRLEIAGHFGIDPESVGSILKNKKRRESV